LFSTGANKVIGSNTALDITLFDDVDGQYEPYEVYPPTPKRPVEFWLFPVNIKLLVPFENVVGALGDLSEKHHNAQYTTVRLTKRKSVLQLASLYACMMNRYELVTEALATRLLTLTENTINLTDCDPTIEKRLFFGTNTFCFPIPNFGRDNVNRISPNEVICLESLRYDLVYSEKIRELKSTMLNLNYTIAKQITAVTAERNKRLFSPSVGKKKKRKRADSSSTSTTVNETKRKRRRKNTNIDDVSGANNMAVEGTSSNTGGLIVCDLIIPFDILDEIIKKGMSAKSDFYASLNGGVPFPRSFETELNNNNNNNGVKFSRKNYLIPDHIMQQQWTIVDLVNLSLTCKSLLHIFYVYWWRPVLSSTFDYFSHKIDFMTECIEKNKYTAGAYSHSSFRADSQYQHLLYIASLVRCAFDPVHLDVAKNLKKLITRGAPSANKKALADAHELLRLMKAGYWKNTAEIPDYMDHAYWVDFNFGGNVSKFYYKLWDPSDSSSGEMPSMLYPKTGFREHTQDRKTQPHGINFCMVCKCFANMCLTPTVHGMWSSHPLGFPEVPAIYKGKEMGPRYAWFSLFLRAPNVPELDWPPMRATTETTFVGVLKSKDRADSEVLVGYNNNQTHMPKHVKYQAELFHLLNTDNNPAAVLENNRINSGVTKSDVVNVGRDIPLSVIGKKEKKQKKTTTK